MNGISDCFSQYLRSLRPVNGIFTLEIVQDAIYKTHRHLSTDIEEETFNLIDRNDEKTMSGKLSLFENKLRSGVSSMLSQLDEDDQLDLTVPSKEFQWSKARTDHMKNICRGESLLKVWYTQMRPLFCTPDNYIDWKLVPNYALTEAPATYLLSVLSSETTAIGSLARRDDAFIKNTAQYAEEFMAEARTFMDKLTIAARTGDRIAWDAEFAKGKCAKLSRFYLPAEAEE